jgi:predicted dehydrogenase
MSRLRLAIIGCGAVIEQRYIYALRKLKWIPTTLIDPSPERRKSVASLLGGQFREAARATEIADDFDAAVVSVPHALHEPLCVELLTRGKHVLVEKPMAATSVACTAMNAAAEKGNARLAVALMRRQAPALAWLKDALDAGAFGKLMKFTIREGYEYNWPLTTDSMWRKEQAGGGVLMDTGAHTMDQIVWWFGEPNEIEYFDDADGGVETNCLIHFRWTNGLSGEVELSRTRTLTNALMLKTGKGKLSVGITGSGLKADEAMLNFASKTKGKPPFPAVLSPELFVSQMETFHTYALGRDAKVVTGMDGARSVALIERCYASRKRLDLPWIPYQRTA